MVALANLRPASFRGARFLVPEDSAEEGRNSIVHKYPDSSIQYVEDNGYCPPEFTLTCVLHGRDCLAQFSRLRNALNRPGPGTLNHPYYGSQVCSVIGPWKVNRKDEDSGVLVLEVKLAVTTTAIFPALVVGSIAAAVTGLASSFVSGALSLFAARFGIPTLSGESINTVRLAVRSTALTFADSLNGVASVSTAVSRLTDDVSDAVKTTRAPVYASTVTNVVTNGTALAASLGTLFRGPFEDNTYSGSTIAKVMEAVDDAAMITGLEAEVIATTTVDLAARRASLLTYSLYVRAIAVVSLAEAIVGTVYTTADAVVAAQQSLLRRYHALPLDTLDQDLGQQLAEVVDAAMDVLSALELQLPRISQITVTDMPASVLAYMLYEDNDRVDTVVGLNSAQNPLLLQGSASILTD